MAAPDFTVTSPGQVNASGDERALFLTLGAQEILGAFTRETKFLNRFRYHQLSSGKSYQFPAIGSTTAAYHTAGVTLAGNAIKHNQRTITTDNKLVWHTFLDDLEEMLSFHEVRGEYMKQGGSALANAADQRLLQVACLAARASATITGGNGGSQVTDANSKTVGADLAADFYAAAQAMDEKDVPSEGRFGAVKPAQYYLLAQTTGLINKDWNGSNGDYSKGAIYRIADIELIKTNSLPTTNISAVTGEKNTYNGDFSNTAAVIAQSGAVGTVSAKSMAFESARMTQNLGDLLVAWYAMG